MKGRMSEEINGDAKTRLDRIEEQLQLLANASNLGRNIAT
jgi:hypothetical protein